MSNNFAALFNLSDADFKQGNSKKKEGTKKKVSDPVKVKSVRYPMPVRVRCGHIVYDFERGEFEGVTLDEKTIKTTLREKYPELSSLKFNLVKFSNEFTEILENHKKAEAVCEPGIPEEENAKDVLEFAAAEQENLLEDEEETTEDDEEEEEVDEGTKGSVEYPKGCWLKLEILYEQIDEKQISYPVTIKIGNNICQIEEELSIEGIGDIWKEKYPEYTGCNFSYDERNRYLIPYFIGGMAIRGKSYPLPVKVGYMDTMIEFTGKDFCDEDRVEATWEELRKLYAKQYPEYDNSTYCYVAENNILVPILNFKRAGNDEKIAIPVTIRIVAGCKMVLTKEDMGGKDSATLEEIRCVLEEQYPEYSKERTEMLYDESGFVIPVIHGSKKGIEIICDRKGYEFSIFTAPDGYRYRREGFSFGIFSCREDGSAVTFKMTDTKIPKTLLDTIVAFFERVPEKEAAAQIFYCIEEESYKVIIPKQETTISSVHFVRDPQLESRWTLVMDIHSHGCYPAFFSSIDNHDEKGTRLFMVIGNMDKAEHSLKLRAGIAGNYKMLELQDVFE